MVHQYFIDFGQYIYLPIEWDLYFPYNGRNGLFNVIIPNSIFSIYTQMSKTK